MSKINCSQKSQIPEGEHFAILEMTSVTTPGDERSRTHPGHGYPESTSNYWNYIAFTNRVVFEADVRARMIAQTGYGARDFVALKVNKLGIKTSFTIEVD